MLLSRGAYKIPLRLSLRESVQNCIRGCKAWGGGGYECESTAQQTNYTRVFLIRDDFPPALASNVFSSFPIMLWSGASLECLHH